MHFSFSELFAKTLDTERWTISNRGSKKALFGVLTFKTVPQRGTFQKYSNILLIVAFLTVNWLCFCIFNTFLFELLTIAGER